MFQRIAGQVVYGLAFIFATFSASKSTDSSILLWGICVLLLIGNLAYFRYLNRIPFWVIIDDETKTLQIKYLFQKPQIVRKEDISAYSDKTAVANLKYDNGPGIYIHVSNGEKFAFSDFNLDNYAPIITFLTNLKIKKLGNDE